MAASTKKILILSHEHSAQGRSAVEQFLIRKAIAAIFDGGQYVVAIAA
ncbi:MAG: hypothetical protein SFU86_13380 [Pirellulaceae bacterium]|nr:hypothetical protein [Pirellulaceae bacterium]